MNLDYLPEESDEVGFVDPWEHYDYDPLAQTGADWYEHMLSASLGGKSVHGYNTTPACETLSKVDEEYARNHAVGRITLNTETTNNYESHLEEDIDTFDYRGHNFISTSSATKESIAYDEGEWEPANRTRAKNASVLATAFTEYGLSEEESLRIVSAIVGEPVSDEILDVTAVMGDTIRREVVKSEKKNHSIHSNSTYQRALTWKDGTLQRDKISENAAMDWGRLTAIARYIGEANVRYSYKYRKYAKAVGVPMAMVAGSWAFVSEYDYMLDAKEFTDIKMVELKSIGLTSLNEDFDSHKGDVIRQIKQSLQVAKMESSKEVVQRLSEKISQVQMSREKKIRKITGGTDVLNPLTSRSTMTGHKAKVVSETGTAMNAYTKVSINSVKSDLTMKQQAREISTYRRSDDVPESLIHNFIQFICRAIIWINASKLLAKQLNSDYEGMKRVGKLKRSFTGTSSSLHQDVTVNRRVRNRMSPVAYKIAKKSAIAPAPHPSEAKAEIRPTKVKTRVGVIEVIHFIRKHITDYKDTWARRYESWSRAFAHVDLTKSILYGGASKAFKRLTLETVLLEDTGFVDVRNPWNSYLYDIAYAYARKRHFRNPNMHTLDLKDASDLAEMFDIQYNPYVPFQSVERFARERMSKFAEDIKNMVEPYIEDEPDIQHGKEESENKEELSNDSNSKEESKVDNTGLEALLFGGGSVTDEINQKQSSLSAVVESWDGADKANQAARANGYKDIDDAFAALGPEAIRDEENTFTRNYLSSPGESDPADSLESSIQ